MSRQAPLPVHPQTGRATHWATGAGHGGVAGAEHRGAPGEAMLPPEEHGEDYISERDLLDREP